MRPKNWGTEKHSDLSWADRQTRTKETIPDELYTAV